MSRVKRWRCFSENSLCFQLSFLLFASKFHIIYFQFLHPSLTIARHHPLHPLSITFQSFYSNGSLPFSGIRTPTRAVRRRHCVGGAPPVQKCWRRGVGGHK